MDCLKNCDDFLDAQGIYLFQKIIKFSDQWITAQQRTNIFIVLDRLTHAKAKCFGFQLYI